MWLVFGSRGKNENKGFGPFFPHNVDFFQRNCASVIAIYRCNLRKVTLNNFRFNDLDQEET
jgi:hypothetical protein